MKWHALLQIIALYSRPLLSVKQARNSLLSILGFIIPQEPRLCFGDFYIMDYEKCKAQQSMTILAVYMLDTMWNVGINALSETN